MPTPVQIHPLTESDIPGVVAAIQEAFGSDDPYHTWMFDEATFNKQRNSASLSVRCKWAIRNQNFLIAKEEGSDKILGVAMWLLPKPVGPKPTWTEWLEDWRLWFNQVGMNLWHGRGGLNVKVRYVVTDEANPDFPDLRYYIFRAAQEEAHAEVWTDPRGYYFLNIMVVLEEARGKGIGRKMVEAVTDRADREGMPCYLESSKAEPNMRIYERMGFRFVKEMVCDDDGAKTSLFCMIRDPRPVRGPATE